MRTGWGLIWVGLWVAACAVTPDAVDTSQGVQDSPVEEGPVSRDIPELNFRAQIQVPGILGQPDGDRMADPHEARFGPEATPRRVRLNWPGSDTSRCLAMLWETDVETLATQVELEAIGSTGPDAVQTLHGASFLFGGPPVEGPGVRMHEVKTCTALEPNTAYRYRVGGEGHWSSWYDYSTPGAPGSFDTFTVVMAGDSRGAYEDWSLLLGKMLEHEPDFVLFSGDMVEYGTNQHEWNDWFDAAGDALAETVLVPAHGNHEFLAANYFAQFSLPGAEQWFSIDYGDLTLVSLNDSFVTATDRQETQVALMDQAFGSAPGRWRVAMHHFAMYTTARHASNELLREDWGPVYDHHNVDLVVNGHNHVYERSVPIRMGEPAEDGTVFLVTGGAGAPLYSLGDPEWFTAVAQETNHYVLAEFGPTGVSMSTRDAAGTVIDSFLLPR